MSSTAMLYAKLVLRRGDPTLRTLVQDIDLQPQPKLVHARKFGAGAWCGGRKRNLATERYNADANCADCDRYRHAYIVKHASWRREHHA